MGAAVHATVASFEVMANDAAVAMVAMRRHGRDGAFKAVEVIVLAPWMT
jgi:hypothetical protein